MLPKHLRRYQLFPISITLKESNSMVVSYLPLGGINVAMTVKYGHCNDLTRSEAEPWWNQRSKAHISVTNTVRPQSMV